MPFLTIVTINFNNKTGLEKTINSVLSQTFADYEYIVIDGLSNDGSAEVIHAFQDRISKWVSERDAGIYNAMNKGLAMASGRYVNFMNSGDEFSGPRALQIFHDTCKDRDFVYGDAFVFGTADEKVKYHPDVLSLRFLLTGMICHQAVFAKLKVFECTGPFAENFTVYGDYAWMMKALRKCRVDTLHIPEVLVNYDGTGLSTTTRADLQRREKDAIHDLYFPWLLLFFYRSYRKWNDAHVSDENHRHA